MLLKKNGKKSLFDCGKKKDSQLLLKSYPYDSIFHADSIIVSSSVKFSAVMSVIDNEQAHKDEKTVNATLHVSSNRKILAVESLPTFILHPKI